jgi:hypothetical protein
LHTNCFVKSSMYMAFPIDVNPADHALGPLSPLPCQAMPCQPWLRPSCARRSRLRKCERNCNVTIETRSDAHPRTTPGRHCTPRVIKRGGAACHNTKAYEAGRTTTTYRITSMYRYLRPILSSFREVAHGLSALLVTSSPDSKLESSRTIATRRDNEGY